MDVSAPNSFEDASMREDPDFFPQGSTDRAPADADCCLPLDTRPLTRDVTMSVDVNAKETRDLQGDTFHMPELLTELPTVACPSTEPEATCCNVRQVEVLPCSGPDYLKDDSESTPCPLHIAVGKGQRQTVHLSSECDKGASSSHTLFSRGSDSGQLFSLFQYEVDTSSNGSTEAALTEANARQPSAVNFSWEEEDYPSSFVLGTEASSCSLAEESAIEVQQRPLQENDQTALEHYLALAKGPGACDPKDLLDGVIFGAKYLGSTQLDCERHLMTSTHMRQAQEAVDRVKAPDGESQPMTEVDIMVSIQRVKVLTADKQETLMDHSLQTISYAADIGNIVVIMACRKLPLDQPSLHKRPNKMLCHVFQSEDAQLIAQTIGQAFGLAYRNFLHSEGVEFTETRSTQIPDLYNADLAHFTEKENCKEVYIKKQQGEALGVAIVESGWGSLLPTVVIANLLHGGPAERSGEISIGDHVISVNGTSLVGLPFSACQGLIQELKGLSQLTLSIVRCPPVLTAIMRRPDTTHSLGFCVENGVICSLVRGGIAEKGGIRVGHRIIEINGQSVVAMPHEKIIQTLLDSIGEVRIKTMPASTYRLLTGQEMPNYL